MCDLEFKYWRNVIFIFPQRIEYMDPEKLIEFKSNYLTFRLKMLEMGQSISEEDIITERHLTVHLGNMFRIWAKQSEQVYDSDFNSGDDPPKASEDESSGPVPQE